MAGSEGPILVLCGREITYEDLQHIKAVLEVCSGLSREELAHTLCEHWGWVTATGKHKLQACMKVLEKLEGRGEIRLPAKRGYERSKITKPPPWTDRTDPRPEISGELAEVRPVGLEVVSGREATELWNEYVDRYHDLGFKKPFGCTLRYFIVCKRGRLGCLLLAGAAKSIRVRDEWIGWTRQQRMKNLPWVVNNSRFVMLPWVRVRHLASHVLGQLARRVREDWDERWGYRPVLMETFVDPAHHQGTSYQAAGWVMLGMSTGTGRPRRGRQYTTSPKMVYVRPLVRDFRRQLCSEQLIGSAEE